MKYLKLIENFESDDDIILDIKDRLQCFEDDLDLHTSIENGRDLEIFITNGRPVVLNKIGRFRFDKNVKKNLDFLIDYLSKNDLKFSIQIWSNGRQVINVNGRGETMTFDYKRADYTYVTKRN